jgi:hypothetical protein
MKNKQKYWISCVVLVVLLTVITYTPLIIPVGVSKPMVLGVPYTLWTSILITIVLVVLTFIGSRVHPGTDKEEGQL